MTGMRYGRLGAGLAGCALLVSWVGTVAGASERKTRDQQTSGGAVQGHVVNESGQRALGGRAGMKGHDQVVLEREGRFSFAKVHEVYDVWVTNQRADTVVLYRGLTRRDPVIHFPQGYESAHEPPHRATIQGILRGDFPFPAENGYMVTVSYWSDRAMALSQLAQGMPSGGPRFGRWNMQWDGEPKLDGTLVALGQHGEKNKPWLAAFLASKPLSLAPGTAASVELKLTPIPIGHIAGEVDILHKDVVRDIHFFYRLATGAGKIGLANCHVLKTYDCQLPDVTSLDGTYCAVVSIYVPHIISGTVTKCGGKLGMTDFSIHVGPAPKLKAPREGLAVTKETVLSWTDDEKGVYRVELLPDSRMAVKPNIEIFTNAKEIRWPDLEGLGLGFPVGTHYRFRVSRLSARASVDELVSVRSQAPDEVQEITSETIEVTLTE